MGRTTRERERGWEGLQIIRRRKWVCANTGDWFCLTSELRVIEQQKKMWGER